MPDIPDVEEVASGPKRKVFLVKGAPAHEQWAGLSGEHQDKFRRRFQSLCHATDDLALGPEKIRKIQNSDDIWEIKIRTPALRALAFKLDNDWYVVLIISKPKKRLLAGEAEKAADIRRAFYEAN